MAPLSRWYAKPALTVLDEPLVLGLIRGLAAQGVESAVVNTHTHPASINESLRDAPIPVAISHEPRLRGRGGGILGARPFLEGSNPFVVANGDMWLELALDSLLDGTPRLVRSYSTDERPTNGYAYVLRVDPAYAAERGVRLAALTARIAEALGAEGTRFSQARWMLPAHGVFQGKNAFGKGAPWSQYARPDISYGVAQFPVATRFREGYS